MCTNGYERICTNRYSRIMRWFLDGASILTHESIKNLENGILQDCVDGNMTTYKSIRKDTLKTNSVENTRRVWLPSFNTVVSNTDLIHNRCNMKSRKSLQKSWSLIINKGLFRETRCSVMTINVCGLQSLLSNSCRHSIRKYKHSKLENTSVLNQKDCAWITNWDRWTHRSGSGMQILLWKI